MEWKYSEDKRRVDLGKSPSQRLRITGHRLSSVVGLNKYQSPFGAWCEITKLVKLPFEETKYTLFGKAVEPKLIQYVADRFPNVMSIEEYYGNTFEEYRYNNFKDFSNKFGGVIDAVSTKSDKKTITMICECKTSSHPEQWANGSVPTDYLLQGALYSYMMGLDRVLFVCTFPQSLDYAHPEEYKVTEENTILVVKKLADMLFEIDDQFYTIQEVMEYAEKWWDTYIENGMSPEFDEKLDKEYLDIIRASRPCEDNELEDVCENAIALAKEIQELEISSGIKAKKDLLKTLEENIKETMIEKDINSVGKYKVTKTIKKVFDEKRFAKEHELAYDEYLIEKETYTLKKDLKEIEEK